MPKVTLSFKTIYVMTALLSVWYGNEFDNVDMFGLGRKDPLYAAVIKVVIYCCSSRASSGLATANTHTTHCCAK